MFSAIRNRIAELVIAPERRAAPGDSPSWAAVGSNWSGVFASPSVAEAQQLATVFACIDTISGAMATLEPRIIQVSDDGTREQMGIDNPVAQLLDRPNAYQSWFDFVEWYIAQCLAYGNAVAVFEVVGDREVLTPIEWHNVQIDQRGGNLMYRVRRTRLQTGSVGKQEVFPQTRVLHLRDRTDNGLIGVSRLSRCSNVIKGAQYLDQSVRQFYLKGMRPSGALKIAGTLRPEQRENLRAQLKDTFQGSSNDGEVLLLGDNMDYKPLQSDARSSQLIETRKYMLTEICRIFNVPPQIVQDYSASTFTNSATAGSWFVRFCLNHWAHKFQSAFNALLLEPGQYLELDTQSLDKAAPEVRWANYEKAINLGVLTPDEVRQIEGYRGKAPDKPQPVAPTIPSVSGAMVAGANTQGVNGKV